MKEELDYFRFFFQILFHIYFEKDNLKRMKGRSTLNITITSYLDLIMSLQNLPEIYRLHFNGLHSNIKAKQNAHRSIVLIVPN